METFRKWLNKPKADDKSLLARFYHADRSLTMVASELDSFDGRDEPDRCSRLVTRLRQHQDKVLAITNLIMEELLGSDRDPRAFRAKFPEEVLQDNLAGQLWFGAECLAAGSSILNREAESKAMRPLAQAVTKSLGNVRILLRDQCLRNNVPNSQTLHLDLNDSTTEQLYESLKIFDRLFAEFELSYVSAMVQVKTNHEYDMQQWICVLFSETLQRALKVNLIEQDKVDAFDPGLMFSIPRLAIVAGLVIFPDGPLNMNMPSDELSEMFRPFRTMLIKVRDLLRDLSQAELCYLEKLLLTNEDVNTSKSLAGRSSIEAPCVDDQQNNNNNNNNNAVLTNDEQLNEAPANPLTTASTETQQQQQQQRQKEQKHQLPNLRRSRIKFSYAPRRASPSISPASTDSFQSAKSYGTASTTSATDEVSDDDERETSSNNDSDDSDASLPIDMQIMSADCATGFLIPNANLYNLFQNQNVPLTGGDLIANESSVSGSQQQQQQQQPQPNSDQPTTSAALIRGDGLGNSAERTENEVTSATNAPHEDCDKPEGHHHHHHHRHNHRRLRRCSYRYSHSRHHHHHHQRHRLEEDINEDSFDDGSADDLDQSAPKKDSKTVNRTSSSASESEHDEAAVALHSTTTRLKYRNMESLLHRLFVCISGVADQLQTNFASDLRQILRGVFLMNLSPAEEEEEEIVIPEKPKESDLFEFRASESDVVIQGSSGSNQSIYSAEEVNPELDNVFANNNNNNNSSNSNNNGNFQRNQTIDLTTTTTESAGTMAARTAGVAFMRSRSVGDQQQQQRSRNNSLGSNMSTNSSSQQSSGQNSPVSARSIDKSNNNNNNNHNNNNSNNDNNSDSNSNSSSTSTSSSELQTETLNFVNNENEQSAAAPLAPPAWIPDDKAPRCMSCRIAFTAFRRRHHCRNCGGVFCGNCSNTTAPLPKYGLIKAVRVCRTCFVNEVHVNSGGIPAQHTTANRVQTAGGS